MTTEDRIVPERESGSRLHLSRRRALQGAAWSVPVISVATAAPAFAYPTTTITVTSGHDVRSGQTLGTAPADASGTGGACRFQSASGTTNAGNGLAVILRITNTGSSPLDTGFTVSFTKAATGNGFGFDPAGTTTNNGAPVNNFATGMSSLWSTTGTSTTTTTTTQTFTYQGPTVGPAGSVDLVCVLGSSNSISGSTTTGDLPIDVSITGTNFATATGKYGNVNCSTATAALFTAGAAGGWVYSTSAYPGSNGSNFSYNATLKTSYPAYYSTHDA